MSTLANNCKHFITETSEGVGIRQRRSDSEGRIREAPEGAQNHRPGLNPHRPKFPQVNSNAQDVALH